MTKAEEFLAAAKILPVGEAALMVSFGDVIAPELLNCSRALTQALEENPFPGIYEFEASYTGVTIFYNPLVLASQSDLPEDPVLSKGFREAAKWVRNLLDQLVLTMPLSDSSFSSSSLRIRTSYRTDSTAPVRFLPII